MMKNDDEKGWWRMMMKKDDEEWWWWWRMMMKKDDEEWWWWWRMMMMMNKDDEEWWWWWIRMMKNDDDDHDEFYMVMFFLWVLWWGVRMGEESPLPYGSTQFERQRIAIGAYNHNTETQVVFRFHFIPFSDYRVVKGGGVQGEGFP